MAPVFYYDVSSPYAYLAALRIGDLIPDAVWRPIAFGIVLRETGRVPWSLDERREAGVAEIDRRARERGLAPLRYPPGWPRDSYSLAPLRAAVHAERAGALQPFTMALYELAFVDGRALGESAVLEDAAAAAGLEPADVIAATRDPAAKATLARYTNDALAAGLVGVPTVAVDGALFWGDDRLEEAASAARG